MAEIVGKYLFGLLCVGVGLLILVSGDLFPGAINPQATPVGYVLLVMGAIVLFPQQYMRLVNPGLGSLTGNLVAHLNQIGVKATEIKPDSPEAIKRSVVAFSNDPLDASPWGVIRVEGRSIPLKRTSFEASSNTIVVPSASNILSLGHLSCFKRSPPKPP